MSAEFRIRWTSRDGLCRGSLALAGFAVAFLFVSSVNSHAREFRSLLTLLIGCPSAAVILLIRRQHFRQVALASSAVAIGLLAGFMLYPRVPYPNLAGDWMLAGAATSGCCYLLLRRIVKSLHDN